MSDKEQKGSKDKAELRVWIEPPEEPRAAATKPEPEPAFQRLPNEPFLEFARRLRTFAATEALTMARDTASAAKVRADALYQQWTQASGESGRADTAVRVAQAELDKESLYDAIRKADADARMGGPGQGANQPNFSAVQERDYLSQNWNAAMFLHAVAAAVAQNIHGGSLAVSVGQYNNGRGLVLPVAVWAALAAKGRGADLSPDTLGRALGTAGWTAETAVYAVDWGVFYRQWFS